MLLEQVFDVPLGVRLMEKIPFIKNLSYNAKNNCHKFNVLLLTFLSYASYHMARKPTSVVKNVLRPDSCNETTTVAPESFFLRGSSDTKSNLTCAWPPFDADNGDTLLGGVDSAFLFAYAFGMYFMGIVGERINVRIFLSIGMIMSGVFGFLFGLAYWADIHSLAYFLTVQVLAGLFQSTGWPGCVAAVGNWFGKDNRGLITGIWRSHHSIGNIAGSLIAGAFVETSWGLSFAVPAAIIISLGILLFFFLVPDPRAVGCRVPDHVGKSGPPTRRVSSSKVTAASSFQDMTAVTESSEPIQKKSLNIEEKEVAISFWRALMIPGVIEYSLSLFFTKLINYTFLYWLPKYLKDSSDTLGSQEAADLSTLFDIGGIFGGILAGLLSDKTGASAFTCAGYFILTIPSLFIYREFGSTSAGLNIFLLFLVGFLANGPYALITTAVSADLGANPEIKGSSRALATVTAIIDGTGSIGAAVGPLIAGALSGLNGGDGWDYVFYALMLASGLGLLFLTRLMVNEFKAICLRKKHVDDVGSQGDAESSSGH